MAATYHNHTTFSDGKATVEELVVAAREQGVDELGVSDHLTMHPSGEPVGWAMSVDDLPAYIDELQANRERSATGGPILRIGLEVDWFEGSEHVIGNVLAPLPLDYVLGSVHYVGEVTIDGSPAVWAKLSQAERDDVHEEYWRQIKLMAQSGLFGIAAHIDLHKKFGYQATRDLTPLIDAALDAVAESTMVVELNTAGWHKRCADAYPALDILERCRKRDIVVTLSADAHDPAHLLRDFDRGAQRLIEAGYDQIARFENRNIRLEPIEDAVAQSS